MSFSVFSSDKIHELSWETINIKYKKKTPNVLELFDLILFLPASSSECERGFSAMKLIKTDYRNKLSSNRMTDIIRIKLHSVDLDQFDPTHAIHEWNQLVKRRPRSSNEESSDSDSDE